ncbi:hypothetical protein AB0E44_13890 [Micrococcus terreus]|uniref:hypothetical protein n=1 Tax=Micrococcus terreus TaxID=574650 RepID=UPI0033E40DF2
MSGEFGEFGSIVSTTQTTVDVLTADGMSLTLSFDPGDYIFSRVYNLTITTELRPEVALPEVKLSHRRSGGSQFVPIEGEHSAGVEMLNLVAAPHIAQIDIHSPQIQRDENGYRFTVTPLGGAFVWVLIPPVFKATAFPPGEPERILDLIRAVSGIRPATIT